MIDIDNIGRTGTRYFLYSLGRIMAEELGYAMRFNKLAESQDSRAVSGIVPSALPVHCMAGYDSPVELWNDEVHKPRYDLRATLDDRQHRRIRIYGSFQNYWLNYMRHAERIRGWFERRGEAELRARYDIGPDDVAMVVRKEDIAGTENDLPDCWYLGAVARLKPRRLFIFTKDRGCDLLCKLLDTPDSVLVPGTPNEHLLLATAFRRIVLSQGTFCWWCGFLSRGDEVYQAEPDTGWNSEAWRQRTRKCLDLRVPEPGWIYARPDWSSQRRITVDEMAAEYKDFRLERAPITR